MTDQRPFDATAAAVQRLGQSLAPLPSRAEIPSEFPPSAGGDHALNPGARPNRVAALTPAAVLVPVIGYAEGAKVLFTRRTEQVRHHSGQVSFPGGRLEECDADPGACALRETEEEIGLPRGQVRLIGALDVYVTITAFAVIPVVGLVRPGFALTVDRKEVADVFEVPLAFLLDPANHQLQRAVINGSERRWWALTYGAHYIWGATAGMLRNLYLRHSASP